MNIMIDTAMNEMAVLSEILLRTGNGKFIPTPTWIADVLGYPTDVIQRADKRCKRFGKKVFELIRVVEV